MLPGYNSQIQGEKALSIDEIPLECFFSVHIERLVNLKSLPSSGFKISCFPLKIKNGSAGPARVVAIMN